MAKNRWDFDDSPPEEAKVVSKHQYSAAGAGQFEPVSILQAGAVVRFTWDGAYMRVEFQVAARSDSAVQEVVDVFKSAGCVFEADDDGGILMSHPTYKAGVNQFFCQKPAVATGKLRA